MERETVQLKDLVQSKGVAIHCVQLGSAAVPEDFRPDKPHRVYSEYARNWVTLHPTAWSVTLEYQGRTLVTSFYLGSGHSKLGQFGKIITTPPTAADVLSSLCSDASAVGQSFEHWCEDFGYDVDSRKAHATYIACVESGIKTQRLLGAEFEEFAHAEH